MKKLFLAAIGLAIVILAGGWILSVLHRGEASILSGADGSVQITAKRSGKGSGGTASIDVGEGEHLHLEYDFTKGSMNLTMAKDEGNQTADIPTDAFVSGEWKNLILGGAPFGKDEITGTGSLDFEAEPGSYTVLVTLNDATGEAVLSSRAG